MSWLPLDFIPHIDPSLCGAFSSQTVTIQGVSKRALQRYSKCYSVGSFTKTFTLKSVQKLNLEIWIVCTPLSINVFVTHSPHSSIWNTTVEFFLKHPALPVEVTLNSNPSR
jgi:hypothetical protein